MNYSSAGCDVCDKDINFSLISSKLNNYLFSKKFLTLLSLSTCTVDEVINFDWCLTAVIYLSLFIHYPEEKCPIYTFSIWPTFLQRRRSLKNLTELSEIFSFINLWKLVPTVNSFSCCKLVVGVSVGLAVLFLLAFVATLIAWAIKSDGFRGKH